MSGAQGPTSSRERIEANRQTDPAQGKSDVGGSSGPDRPTVGANIDLLFHKMRSCADEFGLGEMTSVRRVFELEDRLGHGRFHLAVLGQFKRGKSTLLNALLGEDVLPTAVIPVTSIPIFIRFGSGPCLNIAYRGGRAPEKINASRGEDLRSHLFRVAAEEANPKNELGVSFVELLHPAEILRRGVVLIDTPGVGSTHSHNTEAAMASLAECDAAIFIISTDPPITQTEIEFLRAVRKHVPRLIFVLNKVDYLTADERETAVEFLKKVLKEQVEFDHNAPIFSLSARNALLAKKARDPARLGESGLPAIESYLTEILEREKMHLLKLAVASKACRSIDSAILQLELELRSLRMPLEDLEQRLVAFDRALKEIECERIIAQDLLKGDRARALQQLEEDAAETGERAHKFLAQRLEESLHESGIGDVSVHMREKIAEAIPDFFESELARFLDVWQHRIDAALSPHRHQAQQLIDSVRRVAAELFDMPLPALDDIEPFEISRAPYWVTEQVSASLAPLAEGVVMRLLPSPLRLARLKKRMLNQIDGLVLRNVENLRWATRQNIEDTFRRFGAYLDQRLAETIESTRGAIRTAYERRRQHADQIAMRAARLDAVIGQLNEIREEFSRHAASHPESENAGVSQDEP